MTTTRQSRFMRRALAIAGRARGLVEPNPLVGAVLVRDGAIVAEGYHQRYGQPHAEVEAIADARRRSVDPSQCDLYVTLEPCCHFGKTPPCTRAILEARIPRVYAAMLDPFPQVAGQGAAQLRAAGVEVHVGLEEARARQLNQPFIKGVTQNLPWVIAKWAQTIDGCIATASGHSQWISSAASRRDAHQLRARVDAVIAGVGTVLADDPQLTARHVPIKRIARRVVIDRDLRAPLTSRLLREPQGPPVTWAISSATLASAADRVGQLRARGVEVLPLPSWPGRAGHLDLRALLHHLHQQHRASNVMLEGGAGLLGSFFEQQLVDQLQLYVGPLLVGDGSAMHAVRGLSPAAIDQARTFELQQVRRIGHDLCLHYRAIQPS